MAWSENTIQVTFSGANTTTLDTITEVVSDAIALSLGAVERELHVLVTQGGTAPTTGSVEVHWKSDIDVNADATADRSNQGTLVLTVDPTKATDNKKEGMLVTVERDGVITFVPNGTDQNVTVSAVIIEKIWS